MSRVQYAFDETAVVAAAAAPSAQGPRARLGLKEKMHDRRYMRTAMEALGLFIFGFGSTSLVMHLAAGFFIVSRFANFLPHLQV